MSKALASALDTAFQEFDELLQKAMMELVAHRAVIADFEMMARNASIARSTGLYAVVEATFAMDQIAGGKAGEVLRLMRPDRPSGSTLQ